MQTSSQARLHPSHSNLQSGKKSSEGEKSLHVNPADDHQKSQSHISSPSQFSLKALNMDQLFNKDPNFDVEKYREIFHIPNKRFLEIPGEKRSKVKDAKLLKDLIGNEEMSGILSQSPEKVKEVLTEANESKQDLMILKNEVNAPKNKVGHIENESQRSSFKNPLELTDHQPLEKPHGASDFGRGGLTTLHRENKPPTVSSATSKSEYTPYKPQNLPREISGVSPAGGPGNKYSSTANAQTPQQHSGSATPTYNPSGYKSPTYTPMSIKSPTNNAHQSGPTRGLASPSYNPLNQARQQSSTHPESYKPQYARPQLIEHKPELNVNSPSSYTPSSYLKQEETKSNPPVTQPQYTKYQPRFLNSSTPEPGQTNQASFKPHSQQISAQNTTPSKGYQPVSSKYLANNNSPDFQTRENYSSPNERVVENNPVFLSSNTQATPVSQYSAQSRIKPTVQKLESEKKAGLPVSSGQKSASPLPQRQFTQQTTTERPTRGSPTKAVNSEQTEMPSLSNRLIIADDEPSSYYPGMFSTGTARRDEPTPLKNISKDIGGLTTPTLDDGVNMANYVTNVMNFYEYHLETLKNMVVKQNETILNQKGQIETYEHDLSVYKHKVTDLEDKLREQVSINQQMFTDLQNKYGVAMNELGRFKENIQTLAGRVASQQLNPMHHSNLFQELENMKGGLDDHKYFIQELDQAKSGLQRQIHDLEKMYQDELRKSMEITRQNQIQNALAGYRLQYDKIDQMNQAILASCEATLRDLEKVRESTRQSAYLVPPPHNKAFELESDFNKFSPSRFGSPPEPVFREERRSSRLRDIDVSKQSMIHEAHDDAHREYQKIKHKNERSLVQNLMNWAPSGRKQEPKREYQDNAVTIKPAYQRKGPSSRYQDLESEIEELKRVKRDIEDELLKLPQNLRSANQRRNKAQLERDLEETELQIDALRSELRRTSGH